MLTRSQTPSRALDHQGTPSGVSEVKAGDVITAGLGNLDEISFRVVAGGAPKL